MGFTYFHLWDGCCCYAQKSIRLLIATNSNAIWLSRPTLAMNKQPQTPRSHLISMVYMITISLSSIYHKIK